MISVRQAALAAALTTLALGGCGEAEQPPPPTTAPLPAQVCSQAREALDKLSRAGAFEYSADGQATLEEAVWLPMARAQRDALAQALGFHTACQSKQPSRETSITIKNEDGRVLTQRVVEASADLSTALQE